jgi:hypothetical protein
MFEQHRRRARRVRRQPAGGIESISRCSSSRMPSKLATEALVLLPLALIPTTAVPLAVALHLISLRRLRAAASDPSHHNRLAGQHLGAGEDLETIGDRSAPSACTTACASGCPPTRHRSRPMSPGGVGDPAAVRAAAGGRLFGRISQILLLIGRLVTMGG